MATTWFKQGNKKLKNILLFNLPATKEVCNIDCKSCYAKKAERMYPAVRKSRNRNLEFAKSDYFFHSISAELKYYETILDKLNNNKIVRVHESGEFFSSEYILKWYQIAKENPAWTFYAYTKRYNNFPNELNLLNGLPNFFIINSYINGKVNYGPIESAPKDVKICPATEYGIDCSPETCNYCYTQEAVDNGIYFIQH
jgi:hypothetical protein